METTATTRIQMADVEHWMEVNLQHPEKERKEKERVINAVKQRQSKRMAPGQQFQRLFPEEEEVVEEEANGGDY